MNKFPLDPCLASDSHRVTLLGLCDLRLLDDSRWPWLVLVPQRRDIEEIHDLSPLDQAMLSFETTLVSKTLKNLTGCTKINVGALGNIVRQLHVHVIARNEGDAGWPGPVWGHGTRIPYQTAELQHMTDRINESL